MNKTRESRAVRDSRVRRGRQRKTARKQASIIGRELGWSDLEKFHRTATCGLRPLGSFVSVRLDIAKNYAFYSGLKLCGSVWACPVCAPKIQEGRREEIAAAVAWGYAQGLQPVLVTLTFPHYA